jgi:hypothetical protein
LAWVYYGRIDGVVLNKHVTNLKAFTRTTKAADSAIFLRGLKILYLLFEIKSLRIIFITMK